MTISTPAMSPIMAAKWCTAGRSSTGMRRIFRVGVWARRVECRITKARRERIRFGFATFWDYEWFDSWSVVYCLVMATRYLVNDVEASIDFYQKLGFQVVERWGPAFAIVSKNEDELWLSGPGTSAAQAMPDGRNPEPGGWNRIVVMVDDIDALIQVLKNSGAIFYHDGVSGPGGKQYLVEDPSGNPVEIFSQSD